jgi:transcriptional regulator with XRE-family HTH domain
MPTLAQLPFFATCLFSKFCPLLNITNLTIITTMQQYPNNLRELRKTKGMLQVEVAQRLGHLNPDRISDWEKGHGMPSVANLFKLATVFGVPAEELYKEIRSTAAREVEARQTSLKEENEWVRRMTTSAILNPTQAGALMGTVGSTAE